MTVYLVGAGPGDPGLLTRRAEALLRKADVVIYDRLVHPALVALAPPGATLVDAGKRPGEAHRQAWINEQLVRFGERGGTVVRLKGGDPYVLGRGGEEVEALQAAGVPVEVVPGVTSAVAAPELAGVPVTHRGLATSVTIVTGHVGEPSAPGGVDWAALAALGGTLVILMGVERRAEIAEALMAGGRDPETPVAVVERAAGPRQRTLRTTLAKLGALAVQAPATVVVGPVAGLRLWSAEDRPLHGTGVVLTRPEGRGETLATELAALGAEVVELPLQRLAPPADGGVALEAALADLARFDWVVFTSAEAVRAVLDRVRDARALAGPRLAVVGPGTEAALSERFLAADLRPPAGQERAAGLVACWPEPPAGRQARVLFPRAAAARPELPEGLRAKGYSVQEVEAYRMEPVPAAELSPQALEAARQAAVVVLFSPSSAARYREVVGPLAEQAVVCVGPTTARAASELGFEVAAVAARPDPAGVGAAILSALGRAAPQVPEAPGASER